MITHRTRFVASRSRTNKLLRDLKEITAVLDVESKLIRALVTMARKKEMSSYAL